jgi:UDP:flavonoid glycosyltransferase YjiC (YdhE family)
LPGNISTSRLGHLPVSFLSLGLSTPILESFLAIFDSGAKFDQVLINSFRELEVAAIDTLKEFKNVRMTAIGPAFGAAGAEADQKNMVGGEAGAGLDEAQVECLRWLDKREPKSVVYVAFGSSGILSEDEVREVAAALDAMGQPFLWALRKGSATESLPENFGSGKGLLVSWAPQRQVLGHKSVAAFVSHCGWNSVLESMWSGIPIVACPRVAEQNTNMWLLQEWGVGVAGVDTIMGGIGSIRSATLARALHDVMSTSSRAASLRRRAAEMAAAAHAAVSPSGSSSKAFQVFVNELLLTGL